MCHRASSSPLRDKTSQHHHHHIIITILGVTLPGDMAATLAGKHRRHLGKQREIFSGVAGYDFTILFPFCFLCLLSSDLLRVLHLVAQLCSIGFFLRPLFAR
jgi:hypothetical protein